MQAPGKCGVESKDRKEPHGFSPSFPPSFCDSWVDGAFSHGFEQRLPFGHHPSHAHRSHARRLRTLSQSWSCQPPSKGPVPRASGNCPHATSEMPIGNPTIDLTRPLQVGFWARPALLEGGRPRHGTRVESSCWSNASHRRCPGDFHACRRSVIAATHPTNRPAHGSPEGREALMCGLPADRKPMPLVGHDRATPCQVAKRAI
jgi:hypothetical protein